MAVKLDPTTFVHHTAICESDKVGSGTRIWAFAHILSGAEIGSDCNISDRVFIESDCRLGNRVVLKVGVQIYDRVVIEDEVFVGPGTLFSNDPAPRVAHRTDPEKWLPTRIRRGASLGAGVTVVCGVTVGEYALVGAGSVVNRNVPSQALVVGNPARQIGWVCVCCERLDEELRCICGRSFTLAETGEGLRALSMP